MRLSRLADVWAPQVGDEIYCRELSVLSNLIRLRQFSVAFGFLCSVWTVLHGWFVGVDQVAPGYRMRYFSSMWHSETRRSTVWKWCVIRDRGPG